jgi:hypothetical protein
LSTRLYNPLSTRQSYQKTKHQSEIVRNISNKAV